MIFITLTTEWHEGDFFNGIARGKLAVLCPDAAVVTNAMAIPPFNIMHGAFVVRNTFIHYPEGTIHLIFVNSEPTKDGHYLIVKARGHYFIGADNGIFSLILNSPPEIIIGIKNDNSTDEIDLFTKTAAAIASGKKLTSLGEKMDHIMEKVPLRATIDKDVIIGSILFIDSYGNAITNITREVFGRVFETRLFRIFIKSNKYYTEKISISYSDEPIGELVTRFNSLDLLEVSINGDNLRQLFDIEIGDVVRVEAKNQEKTTEGLF
jgi:S-adenosyl-L-methionine hydrolase (adenosine-forming)